MYIYKYTYTYIYTTHIYIYTYTYTCVYIYIHVYNAVFQHGTYVKLRQTQSRKRNTTLLKYGSLLSRGLLLHQPCYKLRVSLSNPAPVIHQGILCRWVLGHLGVCQYVAGDFMRQAKKLALSISFRRRKKTIFLKPEG